MKIKTILILFNFDQNGKEYVEIGCLTISILSSPSLRKLLSYCFNPRDSSQPPIEGNGRPVRERSEALFLNDLTAFFSLSLSLRTPHSSTIQVLAFIVMHLNSSRSLTSLGDLYGDGDTLDCDRLLLRAASKRGFSVHSSSDSDCGEKGCNAMDR